jgi:hypothetical protein
MIVFAAAALKAIVTETTDAIAAKYNREEIGKGVFGRSLLAGIAKVSTVPMINKHLRDKESRPSE